MIMTDHKNALPLGTELDGKYRLDAVLGAGGFGIVYRAEHRHLGKTYAIKEYLPQAVAMREGATVHPLSSESRADYNEGLARFLREARQLVLFTGHSNIVTCGDYFEANGTAYLVMDFEEGMTLSELLVRREEQGRPLSQDEILRLLRPLLEGLAHVHGHDVLHRDIKPGNIFIRRSDEQPVLLDFGAAKGGFSRHPKSRNALTPGYAALEQIVDEGDLGPWTDIYAIGAVLWRIITGDNPPKAENRQYALVRGWMDPLALSADAGEGRFSESFLKMVKACLEMDEAQRFQSVEILLQQLNALDALNATAAAPQEVAGQGTSEQVDSAARLPPESDGSGVRAAESPSIPMRGRWSALATACALALGGILSAVLFYPEPPVPDDGSGTESAEGTENSPQPDNDGTASPGQDRAQDLLPAMVSIPGGSFVMGRDDGEEETGNLHAVQLDGFSIARTPVTRAEFAAFIDDTGYLTSGEGESGGCTTWHDWYSGDGHWWDRLPIANWREPFFEQGVDHPVVCLTLDDVEAYITWLNDATARDFRLPSEAEWAHAARAGSETRFFFGNAAEQACEYANLYDQAFVEAGPWAGWGWSPLVPCDDGHVFTSPVGHYKPNDFGIFDTVGNVREWTADCWNETQQGAPVNGTARTDGDCRRRVVRGVSWYTQGHLSMFKRDFVWVSSYAASDLGFRLAESE